MKTLHQFSYLLILLMVTELTFKGYSTVLNDGVISGAVHYANADSTVLRHAKVILTDSINSLVDSVFTDNDGNFLFSNLALSQYFLKAYPVHPYGGINSMDALQILRYYVGLVTLDSLPLKAADVNLSGSINSVDALLVQKRFVGLISGFPVNEWISEQKLINLNQQDSVFTTFYVLCAGDVNGSYIPDNNTFLVCGDTLTDVRDGQKYPTVQIGNQCWMQKNLNYGNLVPWPTMSNNGIPEKYCLGNVESQCDIWGGMYNKGEMMQWDTLPGLQGMCPAGFHVPTNTEWDILSDYLGGSAIAGGKMKKTGTEHWNLPNTSATNESGFTALGSGSISGVQYYQCLMWSSTLVNEPWGMCYVLQYSQATLQLEGMFENFGISVRCLKD